MDDGTKSRPRARSASRPLSRRRLLAGAGAAGGSLAFGEALWAAASRATKLSRGDVAEAEQLQGVSFSDADRKLMLPDLDEQLAGIREVRAVALANDVPPALRFDPLPPGFAPPAEPDELPRQELPAIERPASPDDLAFASLTELASLVARREVSSVELTRLYLDRLARYDPQLLCVIHRTEERALAAAERADRELAAGGWRGPLHGIPWGAKDLLAARGATTTWGSAPFREQVIDEDAAVVERLEAAGAVLVAKLTLGELAWGDVWFGGMTRNPWKLEQGSSGSSAGPAAATAAGLVGFAVGSETWGSIVSPCSRCGVTGLRPTFGRVSRRGAMALSWTMDKLGPIARSVEDCALVFAAISGADPRDPFSAGPAFRWPRAIDPRALRVGWVPALFERAPRKGSEEDREHERAALARLADLGLHLVPFDLPQQPIEPLSMILLAEAGAAFDELARSGGVRQMRRQTRDSWPNVLRAARFIPAVEYLRAMRVRTLLMRELERRLQEVDLYLAPSFGDNLLLTNLTGHPQVVVPNGFRRDGTPTSLTFTGKLYGEAELLTVAKLYQEATDFHRRRPPAFAAGG